MHAPTAGAGATSNAGPIQHRQRQHAGSVGAIREAPGILSTLPAMRVPRLSPAAFRRLTLVNVVLLVGIIVSGAVVRLTNFGAGLRRLAELQRDQARRRLDASRRDRTANRIFSGRDRHSRSASRFFGAYLRDPRRRDLVVQAWLLFALFWAEAVLGGISVKVRLAWVSVTGPLPARDRARRHRAR